MPSGYYHGKQNSDKCVDLSSLVGQLFSLDIEHVKVLGNDCCTETQSYLTVFNGSNMALAQSWTARSDVCVDALPVLLGVGYSQDRAVPVATSILKTILEMTRNEATTLAPLQPELVLDELLRNHFDDCQLDCFLDSEFSREPQNLRKEFAYLTGRYLHCHVDTMESKIFADRFSLALRRVSAFLVAEFYCALLTADAPEEECEGLLQCVDFNTVNKCYSTAYEAGKYSGKIFIKSYQGLYNGHYVINDKGDLIMNGSGSLSYRSGDTYNGMWKLRKRHGFGIFQLPQLRARHDFLTSPQGVIYEGFWEDDYGMGRVSAIMLMALK